MTQAKYLDSAMTGNRGVWGGGDELILEEFFPEVAEEEERLCGGPYGAHEEFIEIDEFSDECAMEFGECSLPEEVVKEEIMVIVVETIDESRAAALAYGMIPILMVGGSAVCDPLNLFDKSA